MREHRLDNDGGFTLIELLVTIAVLVVITGIVYSSFASVTSGTDRVRVTAQELRLRQFLERNFIENFSSAFVPPEDQTAIFQQQQQQQAGGLDLPDDQLEDVEYFEGVSEGGIDGPQDSIAFWSAAPVRGGVQLPGDRKIVRYEVSSDRAERYGLSYNAATDEEDQHLYLMASEAPWLEGDDFEIEEEDSYEQENVEDAEFDGPSWRVPIRSMDIEYFDGEEWREEWRYSDEQRLPWAVRIRINFAKTEAQLDEEYEAGFDPEDDPDFDLIVSLPAGLGTADAEFTSDSVRRTREVGEQSTGGILR